jgi:hypothetical protein
VEDWRNIGGDVLETRSRAVNRSAANGSASNPNNLGEVTIRLKALVEIGWGCLAVVNEAVDFAIVELIANDGIDAIHRGTSSNVLAIAATVLSTIRVLDSDSISSRRARRLTCCEHRRTIEQSSGQYRQESGSKRHLAQSGWHDGHCDCTQQRQNSHWKPEPRVLEPGPQK